MEEAIRPQVVALDARLSTASDAEVVAACAEGVQEAFRELLRRYRKSAMTLAYQMLGNGEDAEDIAQEAFVRVFQALPKFRGESAFSTWLYRIVTNLCLGRMRRRRPTVTLEAVPEPRSADGPARQVAEGMLTREVLAGVPPELRVVLLLREQEGLSYREISGALGLPMGTVRSRLSKGRKRFRKLWNQLGESRAKIK
ncbi:MAG: sigma-70 family RNA polymerase sigma factor [Proteobacteria bacterium]|nr:sigma-70 family RNA polymerase sigma factor [Pseudomonadota bacterium]